MIEQNLVTVLLILTGIFIWFMQLMHNYNVKEEIADIKLQLMAHQKSLNRLD